MGQDGAIDLTMPALSLRSDKLRLDIDPARGGSVIRFDHDGVPLFRPACGRTVVDSSCFVLVPFSNRIAHGRFVAHGRTIRLTPNWPSISADHPLHGSGWLRGWQVVEQGPAHAVLHHDEPAGEWPWAYASAQRLSLDPDGLRHELVLTNRSAERMPAGLGFHPFFPCTAQTRYLGCHRREWQAGPDSVPTRASTRDTPIDWWAGAPVATRPVDTVYGGREGDLAIIWPERALGLSISPSANLGCTVVYTPHDADFFCVEPVSHATDAINRPADPDGMTWLDPGEAMVASVCYRVITPQAARRWA